MLWLRAFLLASLLALLAPVAQAGTVLDRIKAEGVIRCGGVARPGLVSIAADGKAFGLYLDLCRAIGAAVLGPEGRMEFNRYDSSKAFDAVREGRDELFFLTATEMHDEDLIGRLVPGPTVFHMTTSVMVDEASPIKHVADLAGQSICVSQGSTAHRHLEAWFAAHHLDFVRMAYQEDVELYDTYAAQVCHALAGEVTTLAEVRLDGGTNNLHSRILPEPLAIFPVMAATGTQDAQWSALVAWSVASLLRAEAPQADWESGGIDSLPIQAPAPGLDKDWQKRVVAAAGSYGDMFRRNLGVGSPYKIDRGPNASWQDGGLFIAPYLE